MSMVAVVILLAVLSVADLLLTLAVIRRTREHTVLLNGLLAPPGDAAKLMLDPGEEPGTFEPVMAADRSVLTRQDLNGALVGFFSPTCDVCRERAQAFAERARSLPRQRVVAVVADDGPEDGRGRRDLVALLDPVARVHIEPDQGPVHRAFGVVATPTLYVVTPEGRIGQRAVQIRDLTNIPPRVAAGGAG
jgi:hypothetical protein